MGDLRFFLGRERGPVTKHGVRNAGALEEVDERAWRHGALQAGGRRPVTASPRVRNRSRVRGIICRSWGLETEMCGGLPARFGGQPSLGLPTEARAQRQRK